MNESESITFVIQDIREYFDGDIIVVDDASTDDTAFIAKNNGVIVLPHVTNMGAWRSAQTGLRYCLERGYKQVITIDADFQHDAKYIPEMLGDVNLEADLLIGSCVSRGSVARHLAWHFFRRITRLPIHDLTSGFRRYNRKAIEVLSSRQATMFEYQDIGILIMLKQLGMSVVETPVIMRKRQSGISRIFKSWWAVGKYLLYTFILSLSKLGPSFNSKYHSMLKESANND